MMKKFFCIVCMIALLSIAPAIARTERNTQEEQAKEPPCVHSESADAQNDESYTQETEGKVPELIEFHKVIYLIWHEAYPVKDYAALRNYLPEIFAYTQKLYKAKLPGILRDKEEKWKEGIAELKKAVNAYNGAVRNSDDQALLDAAELLHSRFEMLVRIIRPVTREVDQFHRVLYVVYHKYLPDKKYDRIKTASEELKLKAEAITTAELPGRLKPKSDQFNTAAIALHESSKELQKICETGDGNAIEKAVEDLHTAYRNLETIFD